MHVHVLPGQLVPREGHIPVENAELYFRDVGHGQPIILLHGGPDLTTTIYSPKWIACPILSSPSTTISEGAEDLRGMYSSQRSVSHQRSKIWSA